MALTKWSPFRRIVSPESTYFFVRHGAGLVYKYDVIDTPSEFIADLMTLPGATTEELKKGFAVKGKLVFACVGHAIYKIDTATTPHIITQVGTSLINEVINVTGNQQGDFIYISGWGEDEGFSQEFELFNIVTNSIELTFNSAGSWFAGLPVSNSANAIIYYIMDADLPDGGFRIVSNTGVVLSDRAQSFDPHIENSDHLCSSVDMLCTVSSFSNPDGTSSLFFNYFDESGVGIGSLQPLYSDLFPQSGQHVATATTDKHLTVITAMQDGNTIYNSYEIQTDRDIDGNPIQVTLGILILSKTTTILDEYQYGLTGVETQSF